MIKLFTGNNSNQLYPRMLGELEKCGKVVSPRGKITKEFSPCITIINNPVQRFMTCKGRGGNPFFLVAEALWILAGRGDAEFLLHYNSKMKEYLDTKTKYLGNVPNVVDRDNFYGAYGLRLRNYGLEEVYNYTDKINYVDQFKQAINKLIVDKDTRQAVTCLWNPHLDNISDKKDYPCNNISYWKIRDGKLNLHQILRSNDIDLGLFPTNVFQWSFLQECMASILKVEVGELLFFSDSLHKYVESPIDSIKVLGSNVESVYDVYNTKSYKKLVSENISFESVQQMDALLHFIFDVEKEFRKGNFDIKIPLGDNLSNCLARNSKIHDMLRMLKIWNLRKNDNEYGAVNQCFKLVNFDFKVSALEYMYRVGEDATRSNIESVIVANSDIYDKKTVEYIMGTYGN